MKGRSLPIFHFHIALHNKLVRDNEGVDRADFAAAHDEAIISARDLMSADVGKGELHMDQAIHIHDEQDRHLATVTFSDALRIYPAIRWTAPDATD